MTSLEYREDGHVITVSSPAGGWSFPVALGPAMSVDIAIGGFAIQAFAQIPGFFQALGTIAEERPVARQDIIGTLVSVGARRAA
jgi:hypothetical protein